MPNAVQFGAGNIGRGFVGQLLFEGGYETVFIDANQELVAALNDAGSYPLRLVSAAESIDPRIGNLRAVDSRDSEAVTQAIADADLISTAVGAKILPLIAPSLATGINVRAARGCGPVDILLCENQWHAGSMMRGLITPHISPEARSYFENEVGLVETVIGRMVPAGTDATRAEHPLLVIAEPYKVLPIARSEMRAPAPNLPGLIVADNFDAYEACKLFIHNMGHAAVAYLGYRRGFEYIWECVEDQATASGCSDAIAESKQAIHNAYGLDAAYLTSFADDLIVRFANKTLGDTVARVAADPLRKLRSTDRLIGAANLCIANGIKPAALSRVIAAALCYDNPADPAAVALQGMRKAGDDRAVMANVCGVAADSALAESVLDCIGKV